MSGVAIYAYLNEMIKQQASDLYVTVGVPPTLRITGNLVPLGDQPLQEEDVQAMLNEVLTSRQRREFDSNMELNLAFDMGKEGRFRVNVLRQRQHTGMVIRRITSQIPSFDQLRLPKIMETLACEKRGLIMVSGITASGKSTSLASMIDFRNTNLGGHIITIEDPIEYYHEHKKGVITQREIGIDTNSYQIALKNALRQKPDVILVGEVRDPEVMEQTITAAETGHLCLATIHTNNAAQAIERITNFFPEDRQQQVRIALSLNLRAIIAQRLVRAITGDLVIVLEILLNEALIKDLILKGDTTKIKEVMANNNASGMITFDQSILRLYSEGIISEQTAIMEADIPADMKIKIQQVKIGDKSKGMPNIDTSKLSL
ncbi:MAG: PilT/PilU family type 4a pilus ATPase [Micavibrio sp.]|nr:PilT/PilU family type 4a pilus ATPase [Micavibrio sp.]